MNQELIVTVISLASGGGLTALIKIMIDHLQKKQIIHNQGIDDRILAWQKIQEKTEAKVGQLELKLSLYEKDFLSLERYIQSLEILILRTAPHLQFPERPTLERELIGL